MTFQPQRGCPGGLHPRGGHSASPPQGEGGRAVTGSPPGPEDAGVPQGPRSSGPHRGPRPGRRPSPGAPTWTEKPHSLLRSRGRRAGGRCPAPASGLLSCGVAGQPQGDLEGDSRCPGGHGVATHPGPAQGHWPRPQGKRTPWRMDVVLANSMGHGRGRGWRSGLWFRPPPRCHLRERRWESEEGVTPQDPRPGRCGCRPRGPGTGLLR